MDNDSRLPPLSQRAPGQSGGRRPPGRSAAPVLPESVVRRVRAAIEASREQEQAAQQEHAGQREHLTRRGQAVRAGQPPHRDSEPDREQVADSAQAPVRDDRVRRDEAPAGDPAVDGDRAPDREQAVDRAQAPVEGQETQPAPAANAGLPAAAATAMPAHPASPWFPIDPDDDTQPFAAISVPRGGQMPQPGDATVIQPGRESRGRPAARPARDQAGTRQAGGSQRSRGFRMAGVFAALLVLLAAGSLGFTLSRQTASGAAGDVHRATAPRQAAGDLAASWIASQVSAAAVVSCDPVTCRALQAHGIRAARLLTLSRGRTDPLRSAVIVATGAVRHLLGSRLTSVYAPAVIASFGSGNQRIDIRAVARHGAAAYESELSADVLARKSAGAILLRSQRVTVSAAARTQLAGGRVDTRLLVTVAGLAAAHPVSILAFAGAAPGASRGMPLRSAEVVAAGTRSSAELHSMIGFLRSRPRGYVPAQIRTRYLVGGQRALQIEFAAPSPLGLLG
jgi:hypothetical protein